MFRSHTERQDHLILQNLWCQFLTGGWWSFKNCHLFESDSFDTMNVCDHKELYLVSIIISRFWIQSILNQQENSRIILAALKGSDNMDILSAIQQFPLPVDHSHENEDCCSSFIEKMPHFTPHAFTVFLQVAEREFTQKILSVRHC
jgi:hypothetical protein